MQKLVLYDKQDQFFEERRPEIRNRIFVGGIQTGKTTVGSAAVTRDSHLIGEEWGWKDCQDTGIIAAPTYKVLQQATLPKFLAMNRRFGEYKKADQLFQYHFGLTVYMRTATQPESMEGISNCRFAWCDELGLMSRYFYENIMGRVARLEAPVYGTTTPYSMGWLSELVAQALSGKRNDTLVVQVRSVDSPYFSKAEYARQERLLDPRRFAMKYRGVFGKMEGLVYPDMRYCKSFPLPQGTKYYAGVDWGFTDPFVISVRAVTPERKHYRVHEFYKSGMIASDMQNVALSLHQIFKFERMWADPSRPEYILELQNKGLPITAGNNDIRIGIDRQTKLIREQRFEIFEDACPLGKDEYENYHYPQVPDDERKPDEDQKEENPVDANNHGCDADRYCTMGIEGSGDGKKIETVRPSERGTLSTDPRIRIEQLKRRRARGI